MAFTGAPQKCKVCEKTVYIAEMISTSGVAYHNTCFRCNHCNGRLAVRSFHLIMISSFYIQIITKYNHEMYRLSIVLKTIYFININ